MATDTDGQFAATVVCSPPHFASGGISNITLLVSVYPYQLPCISVSVLYIHTADLLTTHSSMSDMSNELGSKCSFEEITSSHCILGITPDGADQVPSLAPSFFNDIWQQQPALFQASHQKVDAGGALSEALRMNWNDVANLINHCRQSDTQPLFFQQGKPVIDPHGLYSSNPYAAYLDACSIIVNHADFHSPQLANLCNDLQKTFPHTYANCYITPPNGHAVEAHADDRDVLVIQILGQKMWRVYKNVPIELPFDKEQVGKNGLKVPPSTVEGELCFGKEIVLHPGDVLYMPRGFVHEATTETEPSIPSFHATIAIATHDWCLSVVLSESILKVLNSVAEFRKALPIGPSVEYNTSTSTTPLKQQLNIAMSLIQRNVTTESIEQNLKAKYDTHNFRAKACRDDMTNSILQAKKRKRSEEYVGYNAVSQLVFESKIRVSTPDERESVVIEEGQLRGLTVREETCPLLMGMLDELKQDPSRIVMVKDMRLLNNVKGSNNMICDFTLLSFARCCVELGALAVASF